MSEFEKFLRRYKPVSVKESTITATKMSIGYSVEAEVDSELTLLKLYSAITASICNNVGIKKATAAFINGAKDFKPYKKAEDFFSDNSDLSSIFDGLRK